MVTVVRERAEQAEEASGQAWERLKIVTNHNKWLAEKLREKESEEKLMNIKSDYRDRVIEHMSEQL